jgi:hypothetical protein
MRKNVLVSAALAVVMMANVLFTVDAQAVSRTTTTELGGIGRSVEEAINVDPQVLGARRNSETQGVNLGDITDPNALASLSDLTLFGTLISEYTHTEIKASDLSVLNSMDVKAPAGVEVSEKNPIYISFSFPAITADSQVFILHYGKAGWEVVPTTVVEGRVVGAFTSLSPVAIVAKKNTLKGAVLGANRKKSPRTGDNFWFLIIAGAGIIAVSAIGLQKKYFHD